MNAHPCATADEKFVRAMADAHRHELGFIPHTVYGQALTRGTLRVTPDGTDFAGFVLHGPLKFEAKIWQTFTIEHRRREEIGTAAVRSIIDDMRALNLERLSCRVADDLEAVAFWKALGFTAVAQIPRDDMWQRPLTQYEFIFPAGQDVDELIAAARKRGTTQKLLDFFGTGQAFDKTIKRRARRER